MSTSMRYLWLFGGLLFAVMLWAYLEPTPYHTRPEPIGPSSSLYGPMP